MPDVNPEQIERFVIEALTSLGRHNTPITRDTTLDEANIDSLDTVELAQLSEDELGVKVTADSYEGAVTVADLIDRTLQIARTSP